MNHLNLHRWVRSLRLIVGITCLGQLLLLWIDRSTTLYNSAVIHPEFIDAWSHSSVPTLYDIAGMASIDNYNQLVNGVLLAYGLSILGLFFDKTCNWCAVLVCVLHAVVFASIDFFTYGVDQYMSIICFYLLILGVLGLLAPKEGAMDQRARKNERLIAVVLWVAQAHIALAYFFSGLDKIVGYNWRNGESVWKALHLVTNPSFIDVKGMARTPLFFMVGWATVFLELTYIVWVQMRITRLFAVLAMVLFHISIGFFLGLYVFAAFLTLVNINLFIVPYGGGFWGRPKPVEERPRVLPG